MESSSSTFELNLAHETDLCRDCTLSTDCADKLAGAMEYRSGSQIREDFLTVF